MTELNKLHKTNSNRILVVDDEEFCLCTVKYLLIKLGVDVDASVDFCLNGQEALHTVEDAMGHGVSYVLILTDFSMPKMDGLESTRRIREFYNRKRLPKENQPAIIGVTGHNERSFQVEGLSSGMDAVEFKPLYIDTLEAIIKKHYNQ